MHKSKEMGFVFQRLEYITRKENNYVSAIFSFPIYFQKLIFSRILKFWKNSYGLLTEQQISDWSKLKAFAHNKMNVTKKETFVRDE